MTRVYYAYYGFYGGFEEIDFDELDAKIVEVQERLETEYAGYGRDFHLELAHFAPEGNKECEIDVSYTVRFYEDDEDELELINKSILEKLQEVSIEIEDIRLSGYR